MRARPTWCQGGGGRRGGASVLQGWGALVRPKQLRMRAAGAAAPTGRLRSNGRHVLGLKHAFSAALCAPERRWTQPSTSPGWWCTLWGTRCRTTCTEAPSSTTCPTTRWRWGELHHACAPRVLWSPAGLRQVKGAVLPQPSRAAARRPPALTPASQCALAYAGWWLL